MPQRQRFHKERTFQRTVFEVAFVAVAVTSFHTAVTAISRSILYGPTRRWVGEIVICAAIFLFFCYQTHVSFHSTPYKGSKFKG